MIYRVPILWALNNPKPGKPVCWGGLSCGSFAEGTAEPIVQQDDTWWFNNVSAPNNCIGGSETQCPIDHAQIAPRPLSFY